MFTSRRPWASCVTEYFVFCAPVSEWKSGWLWMKTWHYSQLLRQQKTLFCLWMYVCLVPYTTGGTPHSLRFIYQNQNLNYLYFPFSPSSRSIVVFAPVGLSSFLHLLQVLLGVEVSSVAWTGQLTVEVQITDWGEEFVHWVVLSCDDIIEQVYGGGCF